MADIETITIEEIDAFVDKLRAAGDHSFNNARLFARGAIARGERESLARLVNAINADYQPVPTSVPSKIPPGFTDATILDAAGNIIGGMRMSTDFKADWDQAAAWRAGGDEREFDELLRVAKLERRQRMIGTPEGGTNGGES